MYLLNFNVTSDNGKQNAKQNVKAKLPHNNNNNNNNIYLTAIGFSPGGSRF